MYNYTNIIDINYTKMFNINYTNIMVANKLK